MNGKNKIIKVGIIESDVFGVKAFHCKCFKCGWQSKRKDREKQAVEIAKKHRCKKD